MTHVLIKRATAATPVALLVALGLAAPGGAQAASKAPSLKAEGYRLTWSGGPKAKRGYELRVRGGLRKSTERLKARSFTPAPQSGSRVSYRVRVRGSRHWSRTVRISYRRPGFLGSAGSPATDDRRTMDTMLQANVKQVKQTISFAQVEPEKGKRDWGTLDARMAELRLRGFTVLVLLDGYADPPDWAKNDPSRFRSFARAVVKRYGPGTTADVTWFEPMNEPYYATGARGGRVDIRQFAGDWVRLIRTARSGNRDARFLIPAASDVFDVRTKSFRTWGDAAVRAQPRLRRYVDGIAVHPYTNGMSPRVTPSKSVNKHSTFNRIDLIRSTFKRRKMNVPMFITELGWATNSAGTIVDDYAPPVPPETQAAYLRDTVSLLQKRRWVSGTFFYSWRDYGKPGTAHRSYTNLGLMTFTWQPKPAFTWMKSEIARRGGK